MSKEALFLVATNLQKIGVRHAFSTRLGGVSEAPFDSLNLGGAVGDDPLAVARNLARLTERVGVGPVLQVSQVHGTRVLEVPAGAGPEVLVQEEADALWTSIPGTAVGVRTADCVPLLATSEDGTQVAAIHAGWRGTLLGIAAEGARALGDLGQVQLALGPSIRRCCYEVDPELAARFTTALGEAVVDLDRGPRPHLDLVEANLRVLEGAGLPRDRVEVLNACTACAPEAYFSHRRDQGRSGRHLSLIEVPASRNG